MKKKQILFICGIKTSKNIFSLWKEEINNLYPNYDFNIVGNCKYQYNDVDTMIEIARKAKKLINSYEKTIIIGHSMGGIIGGSIIENEEKIEKYLSLVSPHKMLRYDMNKKKHILGYNRNFDKNLKSYTVGGYLDTIVPYKYTKTNHSNHKNIFTGHSISFFFRRRVIRKMLKLIKD